MGCRLSEHLIGRWLAQIGREVTADPLDRRSTPERAETK